MARAADVKGGVSRLGSSPPPRAGRGIREADGEGAFVGRSPLRLGFAEPPLISWGEEPKLELCAINRQRRIERTTKWMQPHSRPCRLRSRTPIATMPPRR
ncbi:hypothetical protein MPL3365_320015 [Mesorhizobium plurifarium]|uniref:Uncharacterized protein n=1 Tax=Mesorhizobium plurifarium TaxID=69974 RepID=A0A090GFG7_MESPL|nr:hypothetical protein MPL3365_320015 [Mesorhizobium plurifarium]